MSDFVIENGILKKYTGAGGNVIIPNGVIEIGDEAFSDCSSPTSVTIPDSVTSIGYLTFGSCTALKSIKVADTNNYYSSVDGVLFSKDQTKLIRFPAMKADTVYVIPDSVTSIGSWAFATCVSLTSVTIPNSVTSIGNWAFTNCMSLTSVTIPDSVTSIGASAFFFCLRLTDVTIPRCIESIGDDAFNGFSALTNVTIGSCTTNVGDHAFADLNSIIIAPYVSLSDFDPDTKRSLAVGFAIAVENARKISDERREEYIKYIRGQKKRLYPIAIKEPALLRLMLAEKIVPKADMGRLLELAQSEGCTDAVAVLLEYGNSNLKPVDISKEFRL